MLEMACCILPNGPMRVLRGVVVGLLDIRTGLPKLKGVLSFFFYIKFDPHYFYCYLFCFELLFFSILSLSIWYHLIFISNHIFIILIAIFYYFLN